MREGRAARGGSDVRTPFSGPQLALRIGLAFALILLAPAVNSPLADTGLIVDLHHRLTHLLARLHQDLDDLHRAPFRLLHGCPLTVALFGSPSLYVD